MDDKKLLISAYSRFVPHKLFDLLQKPNILDIKLGDQIEKKITILFCDIRDFTTLSESLTPQENFNFINSYLSQMEPLISVNNGIIDKFIGDAIMAIFPHNASDAFGCALQMLRQLGFYNEGRARAGYSPIRIGIGLNTGMAMIGAIGGYNRMEGTVISDAVNLASRVESLTKNYQASFLIGEGTYHELGMELKKYTRFIDRLMIKGKKQPQTIYEVFTHEPAELRDGKLETKQQFEEGLAHFHFKAGEIAEKFLMACLTRNPGDIQAQIYLNRCHNFLKTGQHDGLSDLKLKFEWNDSFLINHNLIDEQHKDLVDRSVRIIDSIESNAGKPAIIDELDQYERVCKKHFHDEEEIMQSVEYPFLANHKEQHEVYLGLLKLTRKEILEVEISLIFLRFKVQVLLIDWLVNHTKKVDRHLGRFLAYRDE